MKKMLFIGAMLVVGMTAFGGRVVELGDTPTDTTTMSGGTSLGIIARGDVVDETQSVLLVVKPTISGGNDEASLHFRFGDIKAGSGKNVDGEFTVEVLNKGVPVAKMTDSLHVNLRAAGEQPGETSQKELRDLTLVKTNGTTPNDDMGTLSYTLTELKENDGKLYTGRIVSNVTIDAGKSGAFSDSSAYVDIQLKNLTVTQ